MNLLFDLKNGWPNRNWYEGIYGGGHGDKDGNHYKLSAFTILFSGMLAASLGLLLLCFNPVGC